MNNLALFNLENFLNFLNSSFSSAGNFGLGEPVELRKFNLSKGILCSHINSRTKYKLIQTVHGGTLFDALTDDESEFEAGKFIFESGYENANSSSEIYYEKLKFCFKRKIFSKDKKIFIPKCEIKIVRKMGYSEEFEEERKDYIYNWFKVKKKADLSRILPTANFS